MDFMKNGALRKLLPDPKGWHSKSSDLNVVNKFLLTTLYHPTCPESMQRLAIVIAR